SARARGISGWVGCRRSVPFTFHHRRPGGRFMTRSLEPRMDVLPAAQRELWPSLRPTRELGYVLYGGTAVAMHLGHRASMDFDFFRTEPLDKGEVYKSLPGLAAARVIQDEPDTFAVRMGVAPGTVKISFFGRIGFGRIQDPAL